MAGPRTGRRAAAAAAATGGDARVCEQTRSNRAAVAAALSRAPPPNRPRPPEGGTAPSSAGAVALGSGGGRSPWQQAARDVVRGAERGGGTPRTCAGPSGWLAGRPGVVAVAVVALVGRKAYTSHTRTTEIARSPGQK